MKITPAILPEDYFDLQGKLARLKGISKVVQIDVCDGKLTPKATWPYTNDREGHFQKILEQEEGMPSWDEFDFEIDMMVRYPDQEFEKWITTGATRIVVHHYLNQHERTRKILDEFNARGVEGILAFGPEDSLEEIYKYEKEYLKNIQLMGIKNIGFQGQPFEENTLEKIEDLRKKFPDIEIAVDGGVNEDSAPLLAKSGADRLVIGSALFNSGDMKETFEYFQSL